MPTIRHRKAAAKLKEVIEEGINMTAGEVLKSADYGTGLQRSPARVFQSEGFKEALSELGFSLDAADGVVAHILTHGKDENRLKASDQIYKRLGGYAAEKHVTLNVQTVNTTPDIIAKAKELLKAELLDE